MEHAIAFGKYDHLLGVKNIAITSDPKYQNIAMILLTPGMLHNAGPYRMYVEIARELEKQGMSSLRFDLSGIGESLGVGTPGKSIDRAAMETKQAMDYLSEQHCIQQFILFGLCSGADDSIQTALFDDRVKGVITLDGLAYDTPRYKFNNVVSLFKKLINWKKLVSKVKVSLKSDLPPPSSLARGEDIREYPASPEQAAQEFQQLVDRGTQLHFIYTGGSWYYNYANQFYDMLPKIDWKNKESVSYFAHMDHVVTLYEDRIELINHISEKTKKMVNALK